ncbi:glycosyltransferase family 2 protein [Olivibacter sp. XZL3]|uniref:glycosyltransferase family 2 protein n=1 Tax=Olivibacter sp. XZL3 TaxID=1735116 RepID=UPI0010667CD9|nr:glycosyltransferase [Olivibacter sp. XZL3]
MTKFKLSVVIPTYKRPALLARCLEALSRQTLDRHLFHILVVGDGYDKETEDLIATLHPVFGDRLTYLYTACKMGPAAARNKGWLHADSTLIAFTDDDCIPDQLWLQEIVDAYQDEEEIVYTGSVVVPTPENPTDFEKNTAQLEVAEFITANCICTKKALHRVGGFDERFKMAWREDSDLHFKFLRAQIPIVKLKKAVVIHPARKAKWGVSIKDQKKGVYNALLAKKFPTLYQTKINHPVNALYYSLLFLLISMIILWSANLKWAFFASLAIWLFLTLKFVFMRLSGTSKSFAHVTEMVFTSILIPYLSIFWQIYGAVKYRTVYNIKF